MSTSPASSAANAASSATSAFIPRDGSSPCLFVPAPAAAASIALSTNASSWSSGKTPWKVSTNRPSIIVITVGSVWIRSWSLMPVWVSTSTFTNTHLPPDRVANCSSLGVSFLRLAPVGESKSNATLLARAQWTISSSSFSSARSTTGGGDDGSGARVRQGRDPGSVPGSYPSAIGPHEYDPIGAAVLPRDAIDGPETRGG